MLFVIPFPCLIWVRGSTLLEHAPVAEGRGGLGWVGGGPNVTPEATATFARRDPQDEAGLALLMRGCAPGWKWCRLHIHHRWAQVTPECTSVWC